MCQIDGVMLALWGFGENMRHWSVLVILLTYSFTCTYSMWQIGKISVRAPSVNRTQGQRAPPGLNRQLLVNHNSMHRILILRWNASPIALGEKKWMHSLTDLSRCLLHRSLALAHSSLQELKKVPGNRGGQKLWLSYCGKRLNKWPIKSSVTYGGLARRQ